MDPGLHAKMGIHHLNRVLSYAPFVVEDGKATVYLTQEDWYVVADTLFQMDTPKDLLPDVIESYQLVNDNQAIELQTTDCQILVEVMSA